MQRKQILTAVLVEEQETYTVLEICQQLQIPEALMHEMEEHGLFQYTPQGEQVTQRALKRIESACRIHHDLGVNLPGVVLALDLLEQLEELRHRVSILERNLK